MRLPGIQRTGVQSLGRASRVDVGGAAQAWGKAALQASGAVTSWEDAEARTELNTAKADSSAALSGYTQELMQRDYVETTEADQAGVIYDQKDIKTTTDADGNEISVIGSQYVMRGMYDAKAKEIYDTAYGVMKHNKSRTAFDNYYKGINSQGGLQVNNRAFTWTQQAMLADGAKALNTNLATVSAGNMDTIRASNEQIISDLNTSGIINNSVAAKMHADNSWAIEDAAIKRAIADRDMETLAMLRDRAENATDEDLQAIGLTQDQRAKVIASAEGARLGILKEDQALASGAIATAIDAGNWTEATAAAVNYPGTPEQAAIKVQQVAASQEMGHYNDIYMNGSATQIQETLDYLSSGDYEGTLPSEKRKSTWVNMNSRKSQLEANENSELSLTQRFNKQDLVTEITEGRFTGTQEDIQNMGRDGRLSPSGTDAAINSLRAFDSAQRTARMKYSEQEYAIDTQTQDFGSADYGRHLDLKLGEYMEQNPEASPVEAATFFASSEYGQIPPTLISRVETVSRNLGQYDDEQDFKTTFQAYQIYEGVMRVNPGAVTGPGGLSKDALETFEYISARLGSGIADHVGTGDAGMVQGLRREMSAAINQRNERLQMGEYKTAVLDRQYNDATAKASNNDFLADQIAGSAQMAGGGFLQQVGSIFDMTPEGTETLWAGADAVSRMQSDFEMRVEDNFYRNGYGDIDTAREAAWSAMQQTWGASYSGTSPVLMPTPPEKFYRISPQEAKDDLARFSREQGVDYERGDRVRLYANRATAETGEYDVWVEYVDGPAGTLTTPGGTPIRYGADMEAIKQDRLQRVPIQTEIGTTQDALAKAQRRYNDILDKDDYRGYVPPPSDSDIKALGAAQKDIDDLQSQLREQEEELIVQKEAKSRGVPPSQIEYERSDAITFATGGAYNPKGVQPPEGATW